MKSKFTWIFTLLLAFFIQFSFAQDRTISGVVTDAGGDALPGVNVRVENGTQGVQTDIDGRYSISASTGQKLVFNFAGMQTRTVTVGASNSISIEMQDAVLDELVVEAYRNSTRATSNVAVTTISSKTIEGRPNANFIQTLQGQIPGLNISTGSGQPGANSTVILRGYGSINGNVEPLYVIDGVPLGIDNFRSINPNDIESVSVLKDAGATSIYGNRGANGVIIVKTKKGNFDSPLRIKYSSVTGFTTLQNNKYRTMNARELLSLEKQAEQGFGRTLTDEQINAYPINTDWRDQIFRTGVSQNHTLSLTSGGANLASFTTFGFFDQQGILKGTDLKRFNFRNNLTGKSSNGRFNYSSALTINYSQRNEAASLGTGSVNINPVIAANNGVPYLDPNLYQNGQQLVDLYRADPTDPSNIGAGSLLLSPLMLLDRLATGTFDTNEIKMIANVQAGYKLTDELTLGTSIGADFTENITLQVEDPNSFNALFFEQGEEFLGWQYEGLTRDFAFNFNSSLNYNKTFAEKHTIDASIFTEYYKSHFKSFDYQQNGLDPKVFEPGNGAGFIGHVPFPTEGSGGSPAFYVPEVSSAKASAGLFSYFGSVDYDYDRKYGLSATVRRDASYRFSESNRWGTFWSVAGRWNIDKEGFMEGSSFKMLKLRASYGTTGNQNISGQSIYSVPNLPRTLFALSPTNYQNLPAYVLGQLGNADVKWETVEQANVGIDFEVLDSRLRGTFDVYQKTTKDLFQATNISGVNGQFSIDGNNGSLRNSGVEALLSYDLIKNQDWLVTVSANGSYNKNEILEVPALDGQDDFGLQVIEEGHPLLEYYAIEYAGVNPANGNLLFYTADGQLTETPDPSEGGDRVHTGKTFFPKYQGGFGVDANYKGFYLSTQFSFVADIWRFDYDLEGLQDPTDIGVFNKSTDLFNSWTPDNRVTDIPSLNLTNKGFDADSDRYLKDASYLRLRYASVGYNFSKDLLNNTPFSSLRAYFQAENLVTWSKWRGWDAESNRAGDQYQYPTPRILSIGLELEF